MESIQGFRRLNPWLRSCTAPRYLRCDLIDHIFRLSHWFSSIETNPSAPGSAKSGRNFFNALPRRRAEALQRRENPFVGHGRAEIRPAVRLKLLPVELILLLFVQLASGRPRESIEVETRPAALAPRQ